MCALKIKVIIIIIIGNTKKKVINRFGRITVHSVLEISELAIVK